MTTPYERLKQLDLELPRPTTPLANYVPFVMVNAVPDYTDHPKVINGCSDLFVNVLGEAGRHARSAVGMGSLPGMMSVEIEAILQVDG